MVLPSHLSYNIYFYTLFSHVAERKLVHQLLLL